MGKADQCWVEFEPGVSSGRSEVLETTFPQDGVSVRDLVPVNEFSLDPADQLRERPQRAYWALAGLLIAMVAWLAGWFGSRHTGLYRAVGTRYVDLLLMASIQYGFTIMVGAVLGSFWAAFGWTVVSTQVFDLDQAELILRSAASTTLLAVSLAPVVPAAVGHADLMRQLKDR